LVLKKLRRTFYDVQSQPEPVRPQRLKAMKRLEDIPETLGRNASTGVVNLDANDRPETPASEQDLPACPGEFHGIPRKITNHAPQQDWIACDHRSCRNHPQLHPLLRCESVGILIDS
jgi:hypothetical protein